MYMQLLFFSSFLTGVAPAEPRRPIIERIVIDDNFPGGYQVEVADVDGDGKPDIVALGGSTCVWYQNPTWKKRIISTNKETPGIISSATRDLDGDGKAEVVIAYEFSMNKPKDGKILLATQGKTIDDPWIFSPISHLESVHRLRWGDLDGDKVLELIAAPIFGPSATPPLFQEEGARLRIYQPKKDSTSIKFEESIIDHPFKVLHAIEVVDVDKDGRAEILTASNSGVVTLSKVPGVPASLSSRLGWSLGIGTQGASGTAPKVGSSEVHVGKLAGDYFEATIDPWHGNQVCVSINKGGRRVREVLDDTLDDGHALWVADIDKNGNDEIFAGHRGKDARVSMFWFDGTSWKKIVLDPNIGAQDLRGGDIDGDGYPDVVAVGGKTKTVVWFRPVQTKK